MKKILAMTALMASVSTFAAVNDLVLTFSSAGPDTYADGTTVLDGERYALVWLPNDSTGFALAADGTVADSSQGEVILTVPAAKGGKCPTVVFELDAAFAATHTAGTWGLYLLDTRTSAADGTVALADASDGRVRAVNAVGSVAGASVRVQAKADGFSAFAPVTATADGATVAATASALPKDVPQPKIKGIRVEGGFVYVTVENTVPYLRYNLAAGTDPANLGEAKAAEHPVSGKAGDEIILVTPAKAGGAFFRVNRD